MTVSLLYLISLILLVIVVSFLPRYNIVNYVISMTIAFFILLFLLILDKIALSGIIFSSLIEINKKYFFLFFLKNVDGVSASNINQAMLGMVLIFLFIVIFGSINLILKFIRVGKSENIKYSFKDVDTVNFAILFLALRIYLFFLLSLVFLTATSLLSEICFIRLGFLEKVFYNVSNGGLLYYGI